MKKKNLIVGRSDSKLNDNILVKKILNWSAEISTGGGNDKTF